MAPLQSDSVGRSCKWLQYEIVKERSDRADRVEELRRPGPSCRCELVLRSGSPRPAARVPLMGPQDHDDQARGERAESADPTLGDLDRLRLERDVLRERIAEYETSMAARSTRWIYRTLRRARDGLADLQMAVERRVDLPRWARRDRDPRNDSEGNHLAHQTGHLAHQAGLGGLAVPARRVRPGPGAADSTTDQSPGSWLDPHAEFAHCTEPVVSIVIPVYGKLELTKACLATLADMATDVAFEVIVVDDCSPDHTWDYLETVPGIVAIHNDTNLGYLRSVNKAAAHAQGEFIFHLNNDTVVADRCLDELVRTARRDPTVGAVGAKLLFPDGRLQEAGSFVWNDASGHNFGHGTEDRSGDHAFVRDTDYCSAAALLVRADPWRKLGGYDDRFAPAYYEDTDLAFGLRSIGLRTLYQPRAVVHHIAGASHGAGEGSDSAGHQERNRLRFVDKWSDELARHSPSRSVPYALTRPGQPHIVVFDEHVPVPDRDSGALRMWHLVHRLAEQGRRVTLVPTSRHPVEPATSLLRDAGIDVDDGYRTTRQALADRCDSVDLIIVSRPNVAAKALPIVRQASPATPVAYDMVDFHAVRHALGSDVSGQRTSRFERRFTKWEAHALAAADHIIAITPEEAEAVRAIRPDVAVTVIGNVHEVPESIPGFEARRGLLFVGSWSHTPNRDAVEFLLYSVMPEIWKLAPDIELHLVGSGLPDSLGADDHRVHNHGWVEDLGPIFDQVRLSIAPLRFGAGIKGKVGDSLARGVPVIGTAIAAEGFVDKWPGFGDVESADAIARATIDLYGDQPAWEAARSRGRAMVAATLSLEAARAGIAELLAATLPEPA